jgi:hypothetical protein
MATILEQLVVLFPSAELHVIHLAIDVSLRDLDAAIAQLIGWGCDFEADAASPSPAVAAARLQRPQPLQPLRASSAKNSSAAFSMPPHASAAAGRWTADTLTSWGHRPWLQLYDSPPKLSPPPQTLTLQPDTATISLLFATPDSS